MPTRKPKYSMNGLLLAGIILVFLGLFFFIEGLVHFASTDKPQFYNIEDAYSSCGVGVQISDERRSHFAKCGVMISD
ncbi:MAG: hypothetical protein HDR17_12830 [Lachnospiraceae bacterium]|nr:hypothetical protein [Lachnospiraceae bacterium]